MPETGTNITKKNGESQLPSAKKAAILLTSIDKELATQVLSKMDQETLEKVTLEISRLEDVTGKDREGIFEEFYQLNRATQYVEQGGLQYARDLLESSLSPEQSKRVLESVRQSASPFNFLKRMEADNILTFIRDEYPQTIALIMSYLEPTQAAEVLSGLPADKQIEVVKRIATMEQTSPEVIKDVEKTMERRFAVIMGQRFEETGGVDNIAEVLNLTDRTTEKGILETLEEDDPDLVERIRRLMFVFEDILLVNDKGVQSVLKEVDNEELAMALKTASDELKDKVFKNMSERAGDLLREDMEYLGPVRISDVEKAQQRIVDIVRRLEETGEVIILGRGGEEDVVV